MMLLACGACDDNTMMMMTVPDMAMNLMPSAPTLGAAIDRMGRPAINTALNQSFNPVDASKNAGKDAYNAEGNQANWATLMVEGKPITKEFAGNLAIIDALDGKCGNQLLSGGDSTGDAGAAEYAALAGVLVDDELYVDTSIGDCTLKMIGGQPVPNYLSVEARFLGLPFVACGGRTPLDDVIDVSYTVLALGIAGRVSDGIDTDDHTASLTDFPFLADPAQ
jgi:hypothetical protein